MSECVRKDKMAISEFLEELECKNCSKKGFEGRTSIEKIPCVTKDNELRKAIIWYWECKYCGTRNSFIHTIS